jgi:hypothetical protein
MMALMTTDLGQLKLDKTSCPVPEKSKQASLLFLSIVSVSEIGDPSSINSYSLIESISFIEFLFEITYSIFLTLSSAFY